MSTYVTKEMIQIARKADLFSYLLSRYPDHVVRVGTSLVHLKERDSVYVKRGFPGYNAFSSGDHGNAVDFLLRYLHFTSFVDAVVELYAFEAGGRNGGITVPVPSLQSASPIQPTRLIKIPRQGRPPFLQVFRYLTGRGIPEDFLNVLVERGVLYQEAWTGNAVFISPQHDYCELRGTGGKPFHGVRKTSSNRFWYWNEHPGIHPDFVFITEGAIDALSLCLLHRQVSFDVPCAYASIGGVANQKTIDRIQAQIPTVLAVDNDPAGAACRNRNPDLPVLLPRKKDWNEDLGQDFPLSVIKEMVIPQFLRQSLD